ncbi:venom serine protease Bi-VSP-like [Ceratina calcarata]|uniref:Venom serine protease Bi-VSP-like n=1 Tax=Ceratina calcarata TaxID=156304 RepID=A0AAJ7WBS6_9HYME|nr:venom serine protease Bi-VSP-like [Ceratina calcarata]
MTMRQNLYGPLLPPQCGFSNVSHPKIVGGVAAKLNAWPWIAALGFKDTPTSELEWKCGGSLISARHVLTAAHCAERDELVVVRLGDLDLKSDDDGAHPIDLGFEKKIIHSEYNRRMHTNDVAILRLERDVQFTCGQSSDVLREVQIPVVTTETCVAAFAAFKRVITVDNRLICTGGNGVIDSCTGDSGGPVMLPINGSFYEIGYLALIGLLYSMILLVSVQGKTYELLDAPQCGYSNVRHPKIVNGVPSKLNAWPWIAVLGYENKTHPLEWMCGGSLITSRHVLTAAHCIIEGYLKYVRLGELDLTSTTDGANPVTLTVDKKTVHPGYIKGRLVNDVAVLKLSKDITFTDAIHPVCLPKNEPLTSSDFVGTHPFVAGWGATYYDGPGSPILREVQVDVLNNNICNNTYGRFRGPVIDNRVICAGYEVGGKDSCIGDSGGPLVIPMNTTYYEIGVVSYGYGCAQRGYPGIYSRVTAFLPFITTSLT